MTHHLRNAGAAPVTDSLKNYVQFCVNQAGSAAALGKYLGFSTGSRVGDWLKGEGDKPSGLTCLKLARFTGHDPIQILRLAEQTEMADLLADFVSEGARDRSPSPDLYMLRLRADLGKAKTTIEWLLRELEGN